MKNIKFIIAIFIILYSVFLAKDSNTQIKYTENDTQKVLHMYIVGDQDSLINRILKYNTNPESTLYVIGNFAKENSQNEFAIKAFKSITVVNPENEDAWIQLGITYYEMDKDSLDKAKSALWKAIELNSENKWTWYNLFLCYMSEDDLNNIIDAAKKTLSLEFSGYYLDSFKKINLSKIKSTEYENHSNRDSSFVPTQKAIDAVLWFALGDSYYRKGNYIDARMALENAVKIDSVHSLIWTDLALTYFQLKLYDKVIYANKKVTELSPNDWAAWNDLGNAYYYSSRYDEALIAYKKSSRLNPDFQKAWNHIGITYKKLGKYAEAVEAWEKCIKIDPNSITAFKAEMEINKIKSIK